LIIILKNNNNYKNMKYIKKVLDFTKKKFYIWEKNN